MELTFAGADKFGCPCAFGGGLAAPPLLHEQALSAAAPSLLLSGRRGAEPLKHSNGAHIGILPLPFYAYDWICAFSFRVIDGFRFLHPYYTSYSFLGVMGNDELLLFMPAL
ncbi:hypothetical protein ACQJBY_054435 [Aegilops geniculata]